MSLQAVLGGAVATTQPDAYVVFCDYNKENEVTRPGMQRVALNSNTDVIILTAPVQNPVREVQFLSVHNRDTASVVLTLKTDDGTTERLILKQGLTAGQSLVYGKEAGFQVV